MYESTLNNYSTISRTSKAFIHFCIFIARVSKAAECMLATITNLAILDVPFSTISLEKECINNMMNISIRIKSVEILFFVTYHTSNVRKMNEIFRVQVQLSNILFCTWHAWKALSFKITANSKSCQ